MILYLARHGETEANNQDLLQGQLPGKLSERGIQQAHAVGKALAREKINYVYCSDLERSRKTAEIVASYVSLSLQEDRDLRERSFGIYEGTSRTAFFFSERQLEDPCRNRPEKGESFEDLYCRARTFLEKIVKRHPGESVAVVSHGDFSRLCVGILTGEPLEGACQIRQKNACLNIFEVAAGLKAKPVLLNSVEHLSPGLQSENKTEW